MGTRLLETSYASKDVGVLPFIYHQKLSPPPNESRKFLNAIVSIKRAKIDRLTTFLGISSVAASSLALAGLYITIKLSFVALGMFGGVDVSSFFENLYFESPDSFSMNSSSGYLSEPFGAQLSTGYSADSVPASDLSSSSATSSGDFTGEPITDPITTAVYDHFDQMNCPELKVAMSALLDEKAQYVRLTGDGAGYEAQIKGIDFALKIADTVRVGKLLKGDTTCNFGFAPIE